MPLIAGPGDPAGFDRDPGADQPHAGWSHFDFLLFRYFV